MMRSQFTSDEWKLLLNAPRWVYVALAGAERGTVSTRRTEAKALDKFLSAYKSRSPLVKEIIAGQEESDDKVSGSLKKAEEMLGEVGALLERKAGGDDGEAVRDMLMQAGKAVAVANREALFGDAESAKEEKALARIETALQATDADRIRRREAAAAAAEVARKREEAARAAAERKAKAAEAKKKAAEAEAKKKAKEAEAKRRAAEEEAAKRKAKAEAKKRAAEAKKKAKEEAAAKRRAEAAAKKKAAEEEAKKKAAAEAEAKKAAEAAADAERIYVVKRGDTLSHIALEVYGNAGRWREIFEANRDVIEKPNLIRPGWKLRIPK